jgi:GNAT superfamily N-acetyltransferase
VNTPGQVLLCLFTQADNRDRHVGYLWYKPDAATRSVFIYDFYIFSACQGQGLGTQALRAFEQEMREQGLNRFDFALPGIMNEPAMSTSPPVFG